MTFSDDIQFFSGTVKTESFDVETFTFEGEELLYPDEPFGNDAFGPTNG